jgi:chromosome segregation ATPase
MKHWPDTYGGGFTMNKAVDVLTFASMILFAGCGESALMQMRRDNAAAETRIATKEGELRAQEDQRSALLKEQKSLLSELDNKQMTLDELNAKLNALRTENAQIKADTAAQQKQKESLDLQIKKYQADVAALQKDNRLPDDEKRRRIDDLKKQISAQLKLMLAL